MKISKLSKSLQRNELRIVFALAFFSFVLGIIGHYQIYFVLPDGETAKNHDYSYWDVFYSTLQMFILESDAESGSAKWTIYLQLARFLAPVVIIWSAFRAAMLILANQISTIRRSRLKNHIVIIGSSNLVNRLIRDYSANNQVIQISSSLIKNPIITNGYPVYQIEGNATSDEILRTARVNFSKRIFIATGSDSYNRNIASSLASFFEEVTIKDKITCHYELRSGTKQAANINTYLSNEKVSLNYFNPNRITARELIKAYPPHFKRLPNTGDKPIHILLVGFSEFGQELAKQLIRVCHYQDLQNLRLTIVDEENNRSWKRFNKETPALNMVADVVFENFDPCSLTLDHWDKLQGDGRGVFDAVYIANFDQEESYNIALDARDGLGTKTNPDLVVVCSIEPISELGNGPGAIIVLYNIDKESWTLENFINGKADEDHNGQEGAKTIHENYLKQVTAHKESLSNLKDWTEKEAHKNWDSLPEYLRDKNRDQADHIPIKTKIILQLLSHANEKEDFINKNKEVLEQMAELEHRRWMASSVIAGFRFGENRDEFIKKTHPDIIPYDRLNEDTKDYDRNVIESLVNKLISK